MAASAALCAIVKRCVMMGGCQRDIVQAIAQKICSVISTWIVWWCLRWPFHLTAWAHAYVTQKRHKQSTQLFGCKRQKQDVREQWCARSLEERRRCACWGVIAWPCAQKWGTQDALVHKSSDICSKNSVVKPQNYTIDVDKNNRDIFLAGEKTMVSCRAVAVAQAYRKCQAWQPQKCLLLLSFPPFASAEWELFRASRRICRCLPMPGLLYCFLWAGRHYSGLKSN